VGAVREEPRTGGVALSFPIVRLEGPPREQGRRHGRELRDAIARNVALYLHRFEEEAGLPRDEALRRAALYGEAIARGAPRYFDEMAGVAEGSGVALEEIALLTVRYELLYDRFSHARAGSPARASDGESPAARADSPERRRGSPGGRADGCTAFAVLPERSADGHLRLCQNWDWILGIECALLHRACADAPASLAFTEAGIPGGKIGLNACGVGLAINGLNAVSDDWSERRIPFHVRCHEALRSEGLDAARRAVADSPRSCSANFLLAQAPAHVVDLETAPESVRALACEAGLIAHTNHFLDPVANGIAEPDEELHPRSQERRRRILHLLGSRPAMGDADIAKFLSDHEGHPDSICRHPDASLPETEHYATVASFIIDLTALEMSVCAGPPCEGRFETVRLAD